MTKPSTTLAVALAALFAATSCSGSPDTADKPAWVEAEEAFEDIDVDATEAPAETEAPFMWFGYECDDGTEFFTASTDGDTMNVYSFDIDLPLTEWADIPTDGFFHDAICDTV